MRTQELNPFIIHPLLALAEHGDTAALRAIEAEVQREVRVQERYVTHLLGAVFPSRDFEMTTGSVGFMGNYVRGLRTDDVFALVTATHQQRFAAALYALEIKKAS